MSEQQSYEYLDIDVLVNILVNPDSPADAKSGAFRAFCNIDAAIRLEQTITVLRAMVQRAGRYDPDMMMDAVELLATDPDPSATRAMLEVLPDVLMKGISGTDELSDSFREYYYQAVVTRSRDDDLVVWGDVLPTLDGRTLVAALLDPAATALQDIEPLTLIGRLQADDQSKALTSLIAGYAAKGAPTEQIQEAADLLKRNVSEAYVVQAAEVLTARWDKAHAAKHSGQMQRLEVALRIIDTRPRAAGEKLLGKRPWAG